MNTKYKMIALAGLVGLGSLPFVAFRTFSGNPRWAKTGRFNYIVNLHPTSFPNRSTWQLQARKALSDWDANGIGGTSNVSGWRSATGNISNHGDGTNMWAWVNQPSQTYLGVTFVRFSGSRMRDCDIWYNLRYRWTPMKTNPCIVQPSSPYSFRGVARHETGHALGLAHETRVLNQMQPIYRNGTSLAHIGDTTTSFTRTGCLPHADDKAGVRFLYPSRAAAYNFMSTNWTSGTTVAQRRMAGSFLPGQLFTVPQITLENQSNRTQRGGSGSTGIRVGIYLSINSTISQADTKVGEYWFTGNWPAHATGNYTTLRGRIPANFPAGTYYVGSIFDCAHGSSTNWNGVRTEGPKSLFETSRAYGADNACEHGRITVRRTMDLQPTAFSASSTTFVANGVYTFRSTTRNNGNTTTPTSTNGYYMSANSTITTSDRLLLSFLLGGIGRGASRTHTANVRMPLNLAAGRCYPGVYVDRTRAIAETSETNNARAGRASTCVGRPDLVISALSASASFPAGGTVFVRSTTRNVGTAVAGSSLTGIYLSTNSTISTSDDYLGGYLTGTLGVGASRTVTTRHRLSYCRRSAVCYVGAFADSTRLRTEISESNNTRSLARRCIAYTGGGRYLNYLSPQQGNLQGATSYTTANIDTRRGGRMRICLTAPRDRNTWYLLVWSRSSGTFAFDGLSNLSIALLNTPIFPAWLGRTNASGSAIAGFSWPRGATFNVRAYTHSLWFNPGFTAFTGFGNNRLFTRLAP